MSFNFFAARQQYQEQLRARVQNPEEYSNKPLELTMGAGASAHDVDMEDTGHYLPASENAVHELIMAEGSLAEAEGFTRNMPKG